MSRRIDADELQRLWTHLPGEVPVGAIARRFGVTRGAVWKARRKLGVCNRPTIAWNKGVDKKVDVPLLFRLWHTDAALMPVGEIAKRLGIATATLYKHAQKHKLPKRPRANAAAEASKHERPRANAAAVISKHWRDGDRMEDDPTPAEIEERAAYCRMMRAAGTPVGGAW